MFKHKSFVRIFDKGLSRISEDMIRHVQLFSQRAGKV